MEFRVTDTSLSRTGLLWQRGKILLGRWRFIKRSDMVDDLYVAMWIYLEPIVESWQYIALESIYDASLHTHSGH